jgi:Flp pilus assembly pilin Flp
MKNMGQSTLEYAVLIAVVSAAFVAMHLYMQRSVQANFKLLEEQINVGP